MASNLTPNLGLPKSIPTQTTFKERSEDVDTAYDNIDAHTHTEGNNTVPWNTGLNKSIDFSLALRSMTDAALIQFINNAGIALPLGLAVINNELNFIKSDGNPQALTKNGILNVTGTGNIVNVSGSASVAYDAVNNAFIFTDDTGSAKAALECKTVIFNPTGGDMDSKLTLAIPSSLASNKTVTFKDETGTIALIADVTSVDNKVETLVGGSGALGNVNDVNFTDLQVGQGIVRNSSNEWVNGVVGGGGGTTNILSYGNADAAIVGNFTLGGTNGFSISTTAADLISGFQVFKITASALNGFVETGDIPLDLGYRNQLLRIQLRYRGPAGVSLSIRDDMGAILATQAIPANTGTTGSTVFEFTLNPGDVPSIKLRFTSTEAVTDFVFDDIVVTPDALLTLPSTTFTLSGGANTVTLSKFNNSNDSPVTNAGIGTFTSSATLTEGTDYEDYGAEWIESITTASTVVNNIAANDSTTQMTYTITSVDNAFDTSRLPTVAFSPTSVVDALPYGADNLDTLVRNPYLVVSASFSGNKLVIVIQGTSGKESGGTATTATSGSANFGLSVTKTVGFGPATLVPSTTQKVVTYSESLDQENVFTARMDNSDDVGAVTIDSQSTSFIKSATKTGTGQITVVFNDNMFSVAPSIVSVAIPPDGTYSDINSDNTQVTNVTATGFNIGYLHQGGGGGGEAHVFRNQGDIDISVSRQGSDYKTPLPTGSYITTPLQSIGTVVDSILTETQYNSITPGDWVLCDGRSIAGSELAILTSVTTAPDMRGRYSAMAGTDGTAPSKTLNASLADATAANGLSITDPGHTHPGTQGVNGGLSGSLNGYQSVTSRQAGGTYDTGSRTTGITMGSSDTETRPFTYVVNKFIKIGD